jgi:acyl dehydratase
MADAAEPVTTRTLSENDFAAPIGDRYFEDYHSGAVYEYGWATVTEAEIVAFARRFDPQLMHTDPGFAAQGPFGGLIASGWHTAGLLNASDGCPLSLTALNLLSLRSPETP